MNLVKQCKTLFSRSTKKPAEDDVISCQSVDDDESDDQNMNTDEVVTNFLEKLEHRFNKQYLAEEGDSPTCWANIWIKEEARLEVNHVRALSSLSTTDSTRIPSYLMERKDRTLNFLWSICRDAPSMERDQVQKTLENFLDREEILLKLYLVSYIKCDVSSHRQPLRQ